ncbi:glycine cleavage system protein GcvH [Desulfofundulus thermosubterraneus]|uniref:Glycine cleavage system H protein n=1 Tax=Desulfofundulus thermosubterraneus DSM 16057 TaxID=1121432 RepID=A0A1M6FGH4_9FIRM|nr:glycine cleavage system protein GcvH [Desulfofundulus thermosubterraneus]SHI96733.1 glycine cleavage system H protein [Desulfofundulus thermosubterraneus DSM 16057]
MYPQELKYHREHAWVRVEGEKARIGVTHYAQEQLGDILFADLPQKGDEIVAGESFGRLESVKSVSDVIAPVSGTVLEVNERVVDRPDLVNQDPYGEGWLILVQMSSSAEIEQLLDAAEYARIVQED